jgi:hypothetical protein
VICARTARPLLPAIALGVCACNAALEDEPWSHMRAGSHLVGLSSGWAFDDVTVEAEGTSGILHGEAGEDDVRLDPQYGGALKYSYMLTDEVSLGLIVEGRTFEAEGVAPLTAKLTPEEFTTFHYQLSGRYFSAPFTQHERWRGFVGLDLGFVPSVEFGNVLVEYPAATGIPDETLDVQAESYWSLGVVAGGQYLLTDDMTLDLGVFYEWSITPGDATLSLANLGGAEADFEVWTRGFFPFIGVSFFF